MVSNLNGSRAVVTGAASGIGHAVAQALRDQGARVVGLDLSEGPNMLRCDLTDESQIIAAVAEAALQLGGIDILVNNAGILQEAALPAITGAHIDRMFSVNVRGAILTTREVLPHMAAGGRIINIASELAILGRADASVYVATKAALIGLTRSWARELAPGILVNAVAPGPTDTPLLNFAALTPAQRSAETAHPLGRIGRPDEVASAVVFLAGPGATFFTGQCLGANGGAAML
ncbi:MAG: short-chain dehydrogenase [Bradyrhizobium sp. PARBB1]|nr:MAG: short-chain dehydrogenase [Bradyrhizobium sp. PARBB1]